MSGSPVAPAFGLRPGRIFLRGFVVLDVWLGRWRVVTEGQAGLLYRDGVFQRQLGPGRHRVGARETLTLVATAQQMATVAGQEMLSQDGFMPKLTAIVEFTVTDPHAVVSRQQAPYATLVHQAVQFALRSVAAGRAAEALATASRDALDAELLALVRQDCAGLALSVDTVRLRDVVLPADLRRLLTGVEKARREGQAALERAHAEQAALRALANAARMLKNNPELQNLRLLQAIGGSAGPVTIVLGTPAGIVPLRDGE